VGESGLQDDNLFIMPMIIFSSFGVSLASSMVIIVVSVADFSPKK
jgi:hypothetical protein